MDWRYLFLSSDGRINRARFWAGVVVLIIGAIIFHVLDRAIGTFNYERGVGILSGLYSLAIIYPAILLYAKRWHDRDKSGWWTLILLVPIIGSIWFLIEQGFLRGTDGENRYGPDPLD